MEIIDNNYFIAIYTNEVKDYCDKIFFNRIKELAGNNQVHIVDNTIGTHYYEKLISLYSFPNFNFYHLEVPSEPKKSQFRRNVETSVNYLRDLFLKTPLQKLLIIESDVIPPADLLFQFNNTIIEDKKLGILGAMYYDSPIVSAYHDFSKTGINPTYCVMSGCSVYNRKLIEKYPFRSLETGFPDSCICMDSKKEFNFYHNHDIRCEHLHFDNGSRQSKSL